MIGSSEAQEGYYWNGYRWEFRGRRDMPVMPPGPIPPRYAYPPYPQPRQPDIYEEFRRWGGRPRCVETINGIICPR